MVTRQVSVARSPGSAAADAPNSLIANADLQVDRFEWMERAAVAAGKLVD